MSVTGSFAGVLDMFDECKTMLQEGTSCAYSPFPHLTKILTTTPESKERSSKRRKSSHSSTSPTCVSLRDIEIKDSPTRHHAKGTKVPRPEGSTASTPSSVTSDSRSVSSEPLSEQSFTQEDLERAFLVFPTSTSCHVIDTKVGGEDEDEVLKAMLLDAISEVTCAKT